MQKTFFQDYCMFLHSWIRTCRQWKPRSLQLNQTFSHNKQWRYSSQLLFVRSRSRQLSTGHTVFTLCAPFAHRALRVCSSADPTQGSLLPLSNPTQGPSHFYLFISPYWGASHTLFLSNPFKGLKVTHFYSNLPTRGPSHFYLSISPYWGVSHTLFLSNPSKGLKVTHFYSKSGGAKSYLFIYLCRHEDHSPPLFSPPISGAQVTPSLL